MLKVKKANTRINPNLEKAKKEVMKEKMVGLYAEIPERDYWKLKEYLQKKESNTHKRIRIRDWIIEKIRQING